MCVGLSCNFERLLFLFPSFSQLLASIFGLASSLMDTNICVFHSVEAHTMAFRGNIKPERWNHILRKVDNMTRITASRAIGEGYFDYEYTWRTNSDIIGIFIGCMAKAGVSKWAMVRLYLNLFNSTWCKGIIEVISSLDKNLYVPLLEMYMNHPPGSLIIANIPRRPTLVIRDSVAFNRNWPKMESHFHFLLGWRKIMIGADFSWLRNYLGLFKAYIHSGVDFENLDLVNFCAPNIDKSSRDKSTLEFLPHFQSKTLNDISEVIMVYRKK